MDTKLLVDFEFKALPGYRMNLRAAARGYWSGDLDYMDFFTIMQSAIQKGFREAWAEGAGAYGIKPDEYTDKERIRLQQEINKEIGFVDRLATFVERHSKANKGKLAIVFQRMEVWAKGYNKIVQIARTYAGGDKKLRWSLNVAEHCRSCLKLNGKVKRASYWLEHDVYPKHWDKLECRGGCKCELNDTDEPLSKGPLPSLP